MKTSINRRVLQGTSAAVGTWQGAVAVVAFIAGVTVMECVAMCHGIDGVLLTSSIGLCAAVVAGFCGIRIGQHNRQRLDEEDNRPIEDDWRSE